MFLFIQTDNNYRDANVDWGKTQKVNFKGVEKALEYSGFLGSDENNFTTTLRS